MDRVHESMEAALRYARGGGSALEVVTLYLAEITDPEKRLAYLNALDRRMRADGNQEWVQAIAQWRLRRQLADESPSP